MQRVLAGLEGLDDLGKGVVDEEPQLDLVHPVGDGANVAVEGAECLSQPVRDRGLVVLLDAAMSRSITERCTHRQGRG